MVKAVDDRVIAASIVSISELYAECACDENVSRSSIFKVALKQVKQFKDNTEDESDEHFF